MLRRLEFKFRTNPWVINKDSANEAGAPREALFRSALWLDTIQDFTIRLELPNDFGLLFPVI